VRIINATAPCRINDIGGWTDTRFAGHGAVCSIAVYPGAEVQIEMRDTGGVWAHLLNYGETYHLRDAGFAQKHPFIAEAIERHTDGTSNLEISIYSRMPPGASTGTSAAVLVALIGALLRVSGSTATAMEIAHMAHAIETDLGYESGIQDQAAAAFGGVSMYEITEYPTFCPLEIVIPPDTRREIERRLVLVYLGKPHTSSEIHKQVIAGISGETEIFGGLLSTARRAVSWLSDGDLSLYGEEMEINTGQQKKLNPGLVCLAADKVIETAKYYGALGWKVNGAGGDGGTVTILTDGNIRTRLLLEAEISKQYQVIPVTLAGEGLQVWEDL